MLILKAHGEGDGKANYRAQRSIIKMKRAQGIFFVLYSEKSSQRRVFK